MEKSKSQIFVILILYLLVFILSLLLKSEIILLANVGIVGIILTIILLNNEKLLILSALLGSIFCNIGGVFKYIPLYIYLLMLVDLIIRNRKKRINFKLKCLFFLSIYFSVIPLIFNFDINIYNIIYTLTKRYCFIIIYIYIINSNLEYKSLNNLLVKPLIIVLTVNIPIFIIQFINGEDRDFIAGIFGDYTTGIVSQLLMILLCIKLKDLYFKKIKLVNLFTWVIISVIYFAIAEVKFGFFIMPIILLVFFIVIKRELKSIIIISFLLLIMGLGYNLYMQSYPQQNFLDKKFVENYLSSESYSGDSVNRVGFKSQIDSIVFSGKRDELFGKGIGSGNPSDYTYLRGSLYEKFDYMKYYWFSLSYIYVENGLVGIILFIAIYIYIFVESYKNYRKHKSEQSLVMVLISIVNMIYIIYNSSLLNYSIIFICWSYFGLLSIEEENIKTHILLEV